MQPPVYPPTFQLSLEQYHALVSFQAHMLMQTQLVMAAKDREIHALLAQVAEVKKNGAE